MIEKKVGKNSKLEENVLTSVRKTVKRFKFKKYFSRSLMIYSE